MNWLLIVVILLIAVGCAVAIGSGATACVDLDSRSGIVVDSAASAPAQDPRRSEDRGAVNCRTGVATK